jgi:hypothetical protein
LLIFFFHPIKTICVVLAIRSVLKSGGTRGLMAAAIVRPDFHSPENPGWSATQPKVIMNGC